MANRAPRAYRRTYGTGRHTPRQSDARVRSDRGWVAICLPLILIISASLLSALGGGQPLNANAESLGISPVGAVDPDSPADKTSPVPPESPAEGIEPAAPAATPPPSTEVTVPEPPSEPGFTPEVAVPAAPATAAPPGAPVAEPTASEPPPAAADPLADAPSGSETDSGFVPADHSGAHNTRESSFAAAATAAAQGGSPEVNQCNGIFNVGGQTVNCNVTITNEIRKNNTTQVVCTDTGAAQTCTTTVGPPITTITQCNGSGSGGGGTVVCSVTVINNVHAGAVNSLVETTVVQCVGSGKGGGSQPTID